MSYPRFEFTDSQEPTARRPYPWFLLGGFILLMLGLSLLTIIATSSTPLAREQSQLQQAMMAKNLAGPSSDLVRTQFSPIIAKTKPDRFVNKAAARLYVAATVASGKKIEDRDLAILRKGADADKAFAAIYSSPNMRPAEAERLIRKLPEEPYVYSVAADHAREVSGLNKPESSGSSAARSLAFGFLALSGLGLGIGAWALYFYRRSEGKLKPLGHPAADISELDADRLGMRAFQLIGGFFLLSILLELSPLNKFENASFVLNSVTSVAMLLYVTLLFASPVMGKRIRPKTVGLSTDRLGKNLLWGVWAWLANIPLLALTLPVTSLLTKVLPPPSHPVVNELHDLTNPLLIISAVFFGSVVAPIWEELAFRGAMFGGLQRLIGVVGGVVVSSLAFGLIHPQGPTLWISLVGIGAMSCFLCYQTRSIIPSITMHMLHNFTLMMVNVFLYGK